jgi:hypothetical protein
MLHGQEPAARVLDRVRSLQEQAFVDGRLDLLLESVEPLRAIIEDPALDPRYALKAADQLIDAESALTQRSRDESRYRAAIGLYTRVLAENPDEPMGPAQLHVHRAGYQLYRIQALTDDFALVPDGTSASEQARVTARLSVPFNAVSRELRAAIELAGTKNEFRADYLASLGAHLASAYDLIGEDHTDEAVSLCRDALSLGRGGSRIWRYATELQLATCLWMRWELHGDESDRREAYRIAKRLMRRGNAFRARAGELLQLLSRKPVGSRLARTVIEANMADLAAAPTRVADAYVRSAEQGELGELADAYALRGEAVVKEAMRREVSADRLRVLAESPGAAAAAGYTLGRGGNARQAAIVLEHSRAILLTNLAGEPGARVRARLLAAGRADLLARYADARRRIAQALREQNAGQQAPARPVTRGGRTFDVGSPTALESAQALLAPVVGEVSRITGLPDSLDLPDYAMIDEAARTGPVVYLAAAGDAGYALIIRHGHEPRFVPLPGLRSELVDGHVTEVTRRPPAERNVRVCVEWLAETLGAVAADQLATDTEVSVIPIGALSLLPVNAALIRATRERSDGPLGVRYLPNARWASESAPWRGYGGSLGTLVIDVADAPGERPLRLAAAEAAALAVGYGARRLPGASTAEALAALPEADVVELLCHASSDPGDPLESGLYLRDGRLTVRMLLARPPAGRQLIILGACETNVIGTQVPDEIIGLPLAFLQAGASGVVATQWRVNEQAAAALLRRFREELATGMAPARALAVAQGWLGSATWGELAERYPTVLRDPLPRDPAMAVRRKALPRFDEPLSWAAFSYTGS